MNQKINLAEKLAAFSEHWSPRTVAQFNGYDVMVVKVQGEFVWHKHDDTDDFFLVLKGTLDIELRDRSVTLGPGELFVVPKGVEHRPVAHEEVHMLLIEPTGRRTPATRRPRRRAGSHELPPSAAAPVDEAAGIAIPAIHPVVFTQRSGYAAAAPRKFFTAIRSGYEDGEQHDCITRNGASGYPGHSAPAHATPAPSGTAASPARRNRDRPQAPSSPHSPAPGASEAESVVRPSASAIRRQRQDAGVV